MSKNRDLPISNYLDILQKEFVVAEIRHKIYPKISNKTFWAKVMEGKKEKIEDISSRNKIATIFNNKEKKDQIYSEIYGEKGLPNFIYKNEEQRLGNGEYAGLQETDIENYFSEGSEVRVNYSEQKMGTITGKELNRSIIFVAIGSSEFECEWDKVTRIL